MAVFGFADTAANIKISGIDTWMISNIGAADGFVSLGLLKDGKISVKSTAETDTRKRGKAFGWQAEISAKMLYTDKTVVLALLDDVSNSATLYNKITLINGGTMKWTGPISWKLVCKGDTEAVRYVEVKATVAGAYSAWDTLWATPGATGTPSGTLATFAPATMYTAQCTALKFKKTGETAETVGIFKNFDFEIGSKVFKKDAQGREYCAGVEFKMEADMMQSSATELNLIDSVIASNSGFQITLADGAIFELTGGLSGTEPEFRHDNDSEDTAVIHLIGTGTLSLTEYGTALS